MIHNNRCLIVSVLLLSACYYDVIAMSQAAANRMLDNAVRFNAAGADINSLNSKGYGPLHIAILNNDERTLRLVQVLLKAGADVNLRTIFGNTSLHEAVQQYGSLPLVEVLLVAGADVNARNKYESTPLHLASSLPVIEVLLKTGADVDARDYRGKKLDDQGKEPGDLWVCPSAIRILIQSHRQQKLLACAALGVRWQDQSIILSDEVCEHVDQQRPKDCWEEEEEFAQKFASLPTIKIEKKQCLQFFKKEERPIIKAQAVARGFLARQKVKKMRLDQNNNK